MWNRRDIYRYGSVVLGGAMALGLSIPGVAYVLDPLRRRGESGSTQRLARLSTLKVGEPQSFAIIAERKDAWVKYPPEPVGTVWLVRQKEGANPPVIAYTAECPHLGCAITTEPDGKTFVCPCHRSKWSLAGEKLNDLSPRSMDTLEVELTPDEDPVVVVHFTRFRTQTKEKIPLV